MCVTRSVGCVTCGVRCCHTRQRCSRETEPSCWWLVVTGYVAAAVTGLLVGCVVTGVLVVDGVWRGGVEGVLLTRSGIQWQGGGAGVVRGGRGLAIARGGL